MTIEQAINHIRYGIIEGNYPLPKELGIEACKMAIKALEQQPCDDAISRQAVFDLINADWKYEGLEMPVGNLPSVTPQPKVGQWNRVVDKAGHCVWECDKCGWQQRFNTNYCPDCGAKKQEEEENDD